MVDPWEHQGLVSGSVCASHALRILATCVRFVAPQVPFKPLPESFCLSGDVIGLKVLGQSIIVLNSRTAIHDLLDERSVIYSDRPSVPFVTEL